jgi:hypothetical protein
MRPGSAEREEWTHLEPQEPPRRVHQPPQSSKGSQALRKGLIIAAICVILYGSYTVLADRVLLLSAARNGIWPGSPAAADCSPSVTVPQYFQTSPRKEPHNPCLHLMLTCLSYRTMGWTHCHWKSTLSSTDKPGISGRNCNFCPQ